MIKTVLSGLRSQVKLAPRCIGLSDAYISRFENDANLKEAVEQARANLDGLDAKSRHLLDTVKEQDLHKRLQSGFVNFYDEPSINPYVPIASKGPWIITAHGAVVYDTGGYGMLGLGHNPSVLQDALSKPQCQANIMTTSFSQGRFDTAMRGEIGHTRSGARCPDGRCDLHSADCVPCPYERFMCLNSGSEAVGLAMRVSDIHAKTMTAPGAVHEGRRVVFMTLKKSFHGRTDRPASASNSSAANYRKYLKSYENREESILVEANNVADLERQFLQAEEKGYHVEMLTLEPVAGEGNPGVALTREFYDAARALTTKYHSLLLVDSIQAGIRTRGNLSVMDSPQCGGAEASAAPDFETFSKALTGGQYPLSVLALNKTVASTYVRGLYGNTMTSNPRGLDVATAMLGQMTPELRANIVRQGDNYTSAMEALVKEFPSHVTHVTGTGLLFALHFPESLPVCGFGGVEEHARMNGLGVIHGGANALRFTPWFRTSDAEVELVRDLVRDQLVRLSGQ